jgi:hypothetical protein
LTLNCPTCGHAIDKVPRKALRDLKLEPQMRAIVDELVYSFPRFVTTERLIDILYDRRGDGGPERADMVVRARMSKLRLKLIGTGWTVPKYGDGTNGRYRLQPVEEK